MNLHPRSFHPEQDYWRARHFLRTVALLNTPHTYSWEVARWDYWRWHGVENLIRRPLSELAAVWEDNQGEIGAILNQEGDGEVFLQVHPDTRSTELEADMLTWAEEHLSVTRPEGGRELTVWAHAQDTLRGEVLEKRGYTRQPGPEYQRRRPMELPIRPTPLPAGFTVRALGDETELPARSWLSWRAFHPDEPDEKYQGWEWYRNIQRAPLYRRDLDLVAVSPDGTLAAFCTVWFDDVDRTGMFEPVGTHPDYHRRGLGSSVMAEGLRRLARLGAVWATVGSYSQAAGALYHSMGFCDYDLNEPWQRVWM